jgi:hypothetical protein
MSTPTKRWTLTWGIHRGTLMSRDVGDPYDFDTLEECRTKAQELERAFRRSGCQMWFTTARDNETKEEVHNLVPSMPYER